MVEEETTAEAPAGSRAQFLARLQRLMDMTLEDLSKARSAKDADETEIRPIRNVAVKLARIWSNTPARDQASPARNSPDRSKSKTVEMERRED